MIPGSISLAVCTVVLRRVVDTITGQIPVLPVSQIPHPSTLLVFSGALCYLYNHLRKGTLVKIGRGHLPKSWVNSSRNSIQHRPKNKSWFLRNAWGRRKNCTDAVYRVAKQLSESITNMNPCLLLPKDTFQVSFPKGQLKGSSSSREISEIDITNQNSCDLIYSNEAFATESNGEVKNDDKKNVSNSSGDTKPFNKRGKKYLRGLKGVKRLVREPKLGDIFSKSLSTTFGEGKKITRSGKVYSPFP
nr:uncharacterized protein LOC111503880 [Leptinotarsa decemlineata]